MRLPTAGLQAVSSILGQLISHPQHRYWNEAPSLLGLPHVDSGALIDAGQISDTYLLALAVHHGGRLATLDQRLSTRAVSGGEGALERIAMWI